MIRRICSEIKRIHNKQCNILHQAGGFADNGQWRKQDQNVKTKPKRNNTVYKAKAKRPVKQQKHSSPNTHTQVDQ